MKSLTRAEGGFSLIELVMAMSFLLIIAVGVGLGLNSGLRTTREMNESQVIQAQAQTFVDRIVRQNFGQTFDTDPSTAQLDDMFDADAIPGDVTINQLTRWPPVDGGWKFTLGWFPVDGEWRVTVDQDINDDSVISGPLETGQNIYTVRIFFNNELVLETCRAKEPTL